MAIPLQVSKALTAASANCICLSQSAAGAANLTIAGSAASGGVATLDTQRRVLLTTAANETALTFTIYGTNGNGTVISEALAGVNNSTTYTNYDFKTVTRVAVSGATTGNVTVGTNGVGSTAWKATNTMVTPMNIGVSVTVSGTVNYTVQSTLAIDPCGIAGPPTSSPAAIDHPILAGKTVAADSAYSTPISAYRITINSGTGTATMRAIEAGVI